MGAGVEQMLTVVQNQQDSSRLDIVGESLDERASRLFPNTQGGRHRLRNERWVCQGGKLHEPYPIPISVIEEIGRHLQAQSRLSCATRTGDRKKPSRFEEALDLLDLLVAANKASDGLRHIVWTGADRVEGREIGSQVRMGKLKHF